MIHVAVQSHSGRSGRQPPLRAHEYLRLCRRAANLSVDEVVTRLRPVAAYRAGCIAMLRLWETPGVVVKADALRPLARVLLVDLDVYRQLATEPVERHPRVCRGCGWSSGVIRPLAEGAPPRTWATADACSACLPDDQAGA